ncbi:protein of unknown function [uncultured Sphingopyxis sp.]|uniref:Uncharacterized protein n=1 Tax=uncultured Sphingopyxis sp. TaxID=310581 RepID=A0A1Y5PTC9_9SPHN|nr:protein of unknown function [uncultured Sphingopyxis sp.]
MARRSRRQAPVLFCVSSDLSPVSYTYVSNPLGIRQVLDHAPVKIRGETYAIPWPQPPRGDALHRGGACRPAGSGESHQRQCGNARRQ